MERGGRSDVRWKTVPQTSGCNRKRFVADGGQGFSPVMPIYHRLAGVAGT